MEVRVIVHFNGETFTQNWRKITKEQYQDTIKKLREIIKNPKDDYLYFDDMFFSGEVLANSVLRLESRLTKS